MTIFVLTAITLVAFAANSLLCRAALGDAAIDASSFTLLRLVSGAVVLGILVWATRRERPQTSHGDWRSASALFLYMIAFSFAYLSLSTGTGALLLFGAVQITMILAAVRGGERLGVRGWAGAALAFGGLVWLVAPGVTAPPLGGAALMILAGTGWGIYSLRGRGVTRPLAATAGNFLRATPMAMIALLPFVAGLEMSGKGIALAVASGALASGLGYAIWYRILPGLSAATAATLQLAVPPLTAFGGALLLDERVGLRLLFASIAVLGGIALVIWQRSART